MKILVCGGAGFIGSNFIRLVLEREKKAVILNFDKLTYAGSLDNLEDLPDPERYRFLQGDIANPAQVEEAFEEFKPDYVINFAAETHVDRSIHMCSLELVNANVVGVFNILEAVKKRPRVKNYVQVSTDEVYGSLSLGSKKKFKEDTAYMPNTPYAATKADGDLLCRAYWHTFKTPVVVTHCSNNYGPYQHPEKLVPFFILRLLENKNLPIYGDGKNVRDWIYVMDHAEALRLCLLRSKPGEIYDIGSNNEMNNLEIAALLLKQFGRDKSSIEFVTDRPAHDRRYAIDASKIRRELRLAASVQFRRGFPENSQLVHK
jgi:dTDP-glucose 4,6-dehydratase